MRAAWHAVDELLVGGVGLRVAQVLADRVVEEVRVLHHEADGARAATSSVSSRTS